MEGRNEGRKEGRGGSESKWKARRREASFNQQQKLQQEKDADKNHNKADEMKMCTFLSLSLSHFCQFPFDSFKNE